MADKKVDRYGPGRILKTLQQTTTASPDPGTITMAEPAHDKARSSLLDKFRRREERWRREQSLHDREEGGAS